MLGKKILVTGAEGFIGSHLVEALIQAGADVTALVLYNSFGSRGWLPEDINVVFGDVRDGPQMLKVSKGQDIVFHLAALIDVPYSYQAPLSYVETNIKGTLNLLEALRLGHMGLMVQTSTSEVYGSAKYTPIDEDHPLQGQSPYSASKIGADMLCESYARSFNLPVAILRPFNTYGPRQSDRAVIPSLIRQMLGKNPTVKVGDLTTVRDFNYVSDTVSAFLTLASNKVEYGRPYNTGTGVGTSIGQILEKLRFITGSRKVWETDPARLRPPNSEVKALIGNSARLRSLGWRHTVSIDNGLRLTVSAQRLSPFPLLFRQQ